MALYKKELSFDNSIAEEFNKYVVNIVNKDSSNDESHGEKINTNLRYPIDTHKGETGSVIEEDGITYV